MKSTIKSHTRKLSDGRTVKVREHSRNHQPGEAAVQVLNYVSRFFSKSKTAQAVAIAAAGFVAGTLALAPVIGLTAGVIVAAAALTATYLYIAKKQTPKVNRPSQPLVLRIEENQSEGSRVDPDKLSEEKTDADRLTEVNGVLLLDNQQPVEVCENAVELTIEDVNVLSDIKETKPEITVLEIEGKDYVGIRPFPKTSRGDEFSAPFIYEGHLMLYPLEGTEKEFADETERLEQYFPENDDDRNWVNPETEEIYPDTQYYEYVQYLDKIYDAIYHARRQRDKQRQEAAKS